MEPPGRHITLALFAEWRVPRFDTMNPERLINPVWEWLIRSEQMGDGAAECRDGSRTAAAGCLQLLRCDALRNE